MEESPEGAEDEIDDLHCEYYWASGAHYEDCAWLVRRWRDSYGTSLFDSDFYICATKGEYIRTWGPTPNIMPALWRSVSSARVYVTDASRGGVHVYDDIMSSDANAARSEDLGFAPEGIWGLDDEHVYAWGIRALGPGDQQPHLVCFDGKEWKEMPSPGFYITNMHGLAPDLIYAAGRHGGMARWNGREWTVYSMPTGEIFSSVFVAGPDEIYATGHAGSLLEGTSTEWSVVACTVDERLPYFCVAKFADELFVGGGPLGLFRRVGKTDELELIKPDIYATHFDARRSLVITVGDEVIGTDDGEAFFGTAFEEILNITRATDIIER